jgi:mannose-6-phosphate isomerase-like protein (cupin superfamily)
VCTATAAYTTNYKKAQSPVAFTKVLFGNVFISVIKPGSIVMFPVSQTTMKSLWILGDVYRVKTRGDETQGKYSVWEIEAAPNNGPPLHKHSMEDEAWYILGGDFSFIYGSKETKVSKGQFVYGPRGEFHTCKNIDGSFGKLLLIITPPQLEKFFEEIGIPIDDKSSFQPPPITPTVIGNVVKAAAKYGVEIKT